MGVGVAADVEATIVLTLVPVEIFVLVARAELVRVMLLVSFVLVTRLVVVRLVLAIRLVDAVAVAFWMYMLRRFDPPQNSLELYLQTILHPVTSGVFPATSAEPLPIVFPQ